ncbi:MAG TPA: hypothetical protein VGQ65_16630 [Thermoanaerobaculia bacterium]|nr:hypothetical protein [Thermoanaerobaculia bacterium]
MVTGHLVHPGAGVQRADEAERMVESLGGRHEYKPRISRIVETVLEARHPDVELVDDYGYRYTFLFFPRHKKKLFRSLA